MKTPEENSGSELLEVESDWKETSGEAEAEAVDLINDLIDDATDELESDGKKVIGTYNYPIITEEKVENGETLHKASTKAEVNWVYGKQTNLAYLQENFAAVNNRIENNYLIVEDELLKRFRKKFKGRYDRIGLAKLDFIDSDISVDFSDFVELPKSINVNTTRTKNCSEKEDVKNLEITIQEKFTEQIRLDRKITTKTEVKFNAGIKSKADDLGLSIKKNWEMDITKSTSEEYQKTETRKETFEYTTPPWSLLTVDAINGIKARKYKLKGTALFDATINLNYKTRHCKRVNLGLKISWDCKTKWHPYAVKLSNVLNIEERLINVDGYLFTTDSKFQERIINVEPANDCFKTDIADLHDLNSDNLPKELEKIRDRLIIFPPYIEDKKFEEGKILRRNEIKTGYNNV